jgi:hypothetical protein
MKAINIFSLTFSFLILSSSAGVRAQTNETVVPVLGKLWQGLTSETSINASKKNPKIEKQDVPSSITILRQDGRHVELTYKNPNYESYEIGTISADGKLLQISYKGGSGIYTISGNKLTGCGAGRVKEGVFSQWFNSYYAWCDELTLIK